MIKFTFHFYFAQTRQSLAISIKGNCRSEPKSNLKFVRGKSPLEKCIHFYFKPLFSNFLRFFVWGINLFLWFLSSYVFWCSCLYSLENLCYNIILIFDSNLAPRRLQLLIVFCQIWDILNHNYLIENRVLAYVHWNFNSISKNWKL